MRYIALIVLALTLVGCGGSKVTSSNAPSSSTAPSSSAPSAPAPTSTIDAQEAGVICNNLDVLFIAGHSQADAISSVESVYHVTAADVSRAQHWKCPATLENP